MIRLEGVSKYFGRGRQKTYAVKSAGFHIPGNSLTWITGHNGAGKTTLMLLMSGLLAPSEGRVYLDGQNVAILPERLRMDVLRQKTGLIFQERFLLADLSVQENLALPLVPTNRSARDIQKSILPLMEQFGLANQRKLSCRYLSGGQKQRLAIARALVNDPAIIFADEPFAHLDGDMQSFFKAQVAAWMDDGKTVIITSHDQQPPLSRGLTLHIAAVHGICKEVPAP